MAFILDGTTGIATVDGSVSAPSQRGQDGNSGISYASDTIKFSTNGVERLAITNSGLSGDGSGLSGIAAGITQADTWRLTSNFSLPTSSTVLTSNFERADGATATYIGSGMSESSGVFTFPTTGKWIVLVFASYYQQSGDTPYAIVDTQVSSDSGSSYDYIARQNDELGGSGRQSGSSSCSPIIDVTNASNFRVRFRAFSGHNGCNLIGDSGENRTCFIFIRLGDT